VKEVEEKRSLQGLRVLVLFGGSHLYGQERANLEVFRTLAPLGLKARFITSHRCGAEQIEPELDRLGFEWTRARFGYHWGRYMIGRYFYYVFINLFAVLSTSWTVSREIRRWRPTHIFAPNWLHAVYAWPAIILTRLPLIYRNGEEFSMHTSLHRWWVKAIASRVSSLVCISRFLAGRASKAGFSKERIRIIYNFPPARSAIAGGTPPRRVSGATVLVYVGQIAEGKGVRLLVEAVIRLLQDQRNICLWMAGRSTWGDPLQGALENAVKLAGFQERVIFLGFFNDVETLLKAADLHICPSLWAEGLTNVVLEAKQAGLPSVVFPMGGIPELIEHEVDGYVCAGTGVNDLIRGIRYFLEQPERRVAAGRRARASLETRFGHERYVRQWVEVFQSTVIP
jgi:glycosyltransferase involved in cell wall biosynthesis